MVGVKRVHGQVLAENTRMLRMSGETWLPHRGRFDRRSVSKV
jgi:hypothetical protein